MSSHDVIVIGGGLAGSLAAIELSRAGKNVVLLERETGAHHKVCGEFLSFEAQGYLKGLGLDLQALGAVPIDHLRLIKGGSMVVTPLPFQAMSLSRYVLDEALLRQAESEGVRVCEGMTANGLSKTEDGWEADVTARGGEHTSFKASTVFLATGKHDLRGQSRPPGKQNNLIGFKMHFKTEKRDHDAYIDLILFSGGYAGLQTIEDGQLNLCLVIDKEKYAALGKDWDRLLQKLKQEVPELANRLEGALPCWTKPLAIFGIPYGFVQETKYEPGFYRIGDQVAVIPSFSGNGMSIALFSASEAVQSHLGSGGDYHHRITKKLRKKVRYATALSRLAIHPVFGTFVYSLCKLRPQLIRQVAMGTRLEKNKRL
jgi:flavin-dependent dehydrogenase